MMFFLKNPTTSRDIIRPTFASSYLLFFGPTSAVSFVNSLSYPIIDRPLQLRYTNVQSLCSRRSTSTSISMTNELANFSHAHVAPTEWSDLFKNSSSYLEYAINLFPPLTSTSHKGSHGRIAIFGGSEKYTGAPYYAARAALNCGVDLVTVFCAKEASIPIKCYSPELMVQSVYSLEEFNRLLEEEHEILLDLKGPSSTLMQEKDEAKSLEWTVDDILPLKIKLQQVKQKQKCVIENIVLAVTSSFPTLHSLCIGPGLGRHVLLFQAMDLILRKAIQSNLILVLDADVLYMLSLDEYQDLYKQLRAYNQCVMTPNVMEFKRLNDAFKKNTLNDGSTIQSIDGQHSCLLVQKGENDIITQACKSMQCKEQGGLKRSGGIGDVLAGTIAAYLAWSKVLYLDEEKTSILNHQQQGLLFSVWAACCTVKKSTKCAYEKLRRAMTAQDVLNEIGEVIRKMEMDLEVNQLQHSTTVSISKSIS